jgi:hypothetical protein
LLAAAAPNGTENRLSYASTATTSSNPRSRDTQVTQSTTTSCTDSGLRDSKASARVSIAYPDYQERDLNDYEYGMTGVRKSKPGEPGYHRPRMPFEESRTSRPVATAYQGYQDHHPNGPEPKYMNPRVQELNGHELDYRRPRIRDLGVSQLESSSITPRQSLRHKISSPSLRKTI